MSHVINGSNIRCLIDDAPVRYEKSARVYIDDDNITIKVIYLLIDEANGQTYQLNQIVGREVDVKLENMPDSPYYVDGTYTFSSIEVTISAEDAATVELTLVKTK